MISYFSNVFLSLATNDPELSKILSDIDEATTYKERLRIANKHFEELGSGSSRTAFKYKNFTIKIAKNQKGIDQNKAEANPDLNSMYINKVLDISKNNFWTKSNYLKILSENKFKDLTGFSFSDYSTSLNIFFDNSSSSKPKDYDKIIKKPYFKDWVKAIKDHDLMIGDLSKISSFATNGKYPVLIDSGLTKKIFNKHYE